MYIHTTARSQAKPIKESVGILAILYLNDILEIVYLRLEKAKMYIFSRAINQNTEKNPGAAPQK